jgi:hypothetical protein
MAEIMIKVECSKRWFFWPVFFALKAAYKLRLISLTRAAEIAAKGMRMELAK